MQSAEGVLLPGEWPLLGEVILLFPRKVHFNSSVQLKKNTYMGNLEKWYRCTYLQSRSRDTDIEKKSMDTEWGKGCGMNWEIGTETYALLYIKQVPNGNLPNTTGTLRDAV